MRRALLLVGLMSVLAGPARPHDIPNARVDRSIQATVGPGQLAIAYEVSLSELTLTQDLRALIGALPGVDRDAWYHRYGEETGPLVGRGLLVSVDGRPVGLGFEGFVWEVEEHPIFTFQYRAEVPPRGRLAIQDTNFISSEGMSRLAVRGRGGIELAGDDEPPDAEAIAWRPVWLLSDAEERRTREVEVDFVSTATPTAADPLARSETTDGPETETEPESPAGRLAPAATALEPARGGAKARLSDLFAGGPVSWASLAVLGVVAFLLGAAHAVQPGHGKALVAATVVGARGDWLKGVLLAAIITVAHVGGVLLIASALWVTRSTRYEAIDQVLVRSAGFVIAAIGLWRLGRHLGGFGEHDAPDAPRAATVSDRSLLGLGLAAGMVPCWDAVLLIVLAEALGRLGLGLVLLIAFSLGAAAVLVAVGWAAGRVRGFLTRWDHQEVWERRFGLFSALVLSAIGLYLLVA